MITDEQRQALAESPEYQEVQAVKARLKELSESVGFTGVKELEEGEYRMLTSWTISELHSMLGELANKVSGLEQAIYGAVNAAKGE